MAAGDPASLPPNAQSLRIVTLAATPTAWNSQTSAARRFVASLDKRSARSETCVSACSPAATSVAASKMAKSAAIAQLAEPTAAYEGWPAVGRVSIRLGWARDAVCSVPVCVPGERTPSFSLTKRKAAFAASANAHSRRVTAVGSRRTKRQRRPLLGHVLCVYVGEKRFEPALHSRPRISECRDRAQSHEVTQGRVCRIGKHALSTRDRRGITPHQATTPARPRALRLRGGEEIRAGPAFAPRISECRDRAPSHEVTQGRVCRIGKRALSTRDRLGITPQREKRFELSTSTLARGSNRVSERYQALRLIAISDSCVAGRSQPLRPGRSKWCLWWCPTEVGYHQRDARWMLGVKI
jgi:hypothetical protein